jgi:hypothetical protein
MDTFFNVVFGSMLVSLAALLWVGVVVVAFYAGHSIQKTIRLEGRGW